MKNIFVTLMFVLFSFNAFANDCLFLKIPDHNGGLKGAIKISAITSIYRPSRDRVSINNGVINLKFLNRNEAKKFVSNVLKRIEKCSKK